MKQMKQLAACFMAMVLLCCGCSVGGPDLSEPKDITALPLAELDASVSAGFSDVPDSAWYAEAAGWGLANGIFDAGVFSPQMSMYRPMVAEALYRAAGSPAVGMAASFPDVPEGRYTAPTAWAAEQGLMSGYANGNFGLNDPVTREQMAAIRWFI